MKIHLTGIGGVAMGNLAAMLKQSGHTVSGSDEAIYPPMSNRLREWAIEATEYSRSNVGHADLYIIGNALSRGNPEIEEILNKNVSYMSMSQAIAHFFLEGKQVVVVAGTHGKTTTTFLIDHVLAAGGKKPGLFAGGVRADGMDGFRVSDSPYFIIEGDEYDTAFFDKSPKFVHYRPRVLVLTAIEFDHADIFTDLKAYKQAFEHLVRLIPSEGLVVACGEDKGVKEILKDYKYSPIDWYDKKCFRRDGDSVDFDIAKRIHRFPLPGDHNALNACAAIRVARHLGVSAEKIRFALGGFPGVLRRQQLRLEVQVPIPERGKTQRSRVFAPAALVEDFAHHPTAVRETIAAVIQRYPGRRVTAMFEPRSASSHRELFRKDYTAAFKLADDIILCDVFNRKKVTKAELLDVKRIARDLTTMKKGGRSPKGKVQYAADPKAAFTAFKKAFKPSPTGDVILMMSNGAFGGIYSQMDDYLKSLASP